VKAAVAAIDGRGGGRPEMAQGKGTKADGMGQAMEAIRTALTKAG
jgi:alanyl-tRNA synthetase